VTSGKASGVAGEAPGLGADPAAGWAPLQALLARPAAGRPGQHDLVPGLQPGSARSYLFDDACPFVPEYGGQPRLSKGPVAPMQAAVAHTTGYQPHQDFSLPRR